MSAVRPTTAEPAATDASSERARLPIGVVLERRRSDAAWQEFAWRPVAVIPRAPAVSQPRLMRDGDGIALYHAATLDLELFASDTEGYRLNLSQTPPAIFVLWRHDPLAGDGVPDVFHVTVCPYEAEDYLDGSDTVVEPVAMPPDIAQWVGNYVLRHHVDAPFVKRQRGPLAAPDEGDDG